MGWGQTSDPTGWGSQWITDHAKSGKTANKPVILEEFGVTDNQASTYTAWYNTIISSGLTGDLIWCVQSSRIHIWKSRVLTLPIYRQAGSRFPSGSTHDDGYTVRVLVL